MSDAIDEKARQVAHGKLFLDGCYYGEQDDEEEGGVYPYHSRFCDSMTAAIADALRAHGIAAARAFGERIATFLDDEAVREDGLGLFTAAAASRFYAKKIRATLPDAALPASPPSDPRPEQFDTALARATDALKVLGTGKLRDRPLIREGARAYPAQPDTRPEADMVLAKSQVCQPVRRLSASHQRPRPSRGTRGRLANRGHRRNQVTPSSCCYSVATGFQAP
jgi:hypothetical protein